ncbi:TonB-dependent siderophore receptor [Vibrio salinus]|uniref:TonB-dependent siderophore receptor n=1 Tax=Vibrio salinus TaxID=2899784 RepID=UPI001E41B8A4|nr:TonB-dependent siderophore receptor [Vibrio salinus]MCE0496095.1 TonB-dependent siderophore receptor [Vibrio salinus]
MFIRLKPLNMAVLMGLAGSSFSSVAHSETDQNSVDDVIEVTASKTEMNSSYKPEETSSATGLSLNALETPQGLTVISSEQMDDFAVEDLKDALDMATGVNVERVETDRTYYSARGFDITNFQLDGTGIPSVWGLQLGDVDTAIYDRVEVVRGANGLTSASGMPSATVNLVRKRPTRDFQGKLKGTVGSWDKRRVEGDISGALNDEGTVRGRMVGVYGDKNSYLDRYGKEKYVFYGIVDWDITDRSTVTVGYSDATNKAKSPMWGALPFSEDRSGFDVSASTSADWAYWNTHNKNAFAELEHHFSNGWTAKTRLNYTKIKGDSKLLYIYESSGLRAYSSAYDNDVDQTLFDVQLSGNYELLGRQHEATFGYQWFHSAVWDLSGYGPTFDSISLSEVLSGSYSEPALNQSFDGSNYDQYQRGAFAATRLSITDKLSMLIGGRMTAASIAGLAYGTNKSSDFDYQFVPYGGITYEVVNDVMLYTSYSKVYEPQNKFDESGQVLDPIQGNSIEIGAKSNFANDKAYASLALFRASQDNVAAVAGTNGGTTYYTGEDGITSKGVEAEVAGEVIKGLQVQAGYTYTDAEDPDGSRALTYTPRNLVKVSGTYRFDAIPEWKVGATYHWQDGVYSSTNDYLRQGAYGVVGVMTSYDITDDIKASLNINNVTDKKYLTSTRWGQSYYAAPLNAVASVSWNF